MNSSTENAKLRARCQAAESALRLLLAVAEEAIPHVILLDEAASARLLQIAQKVKQELFDPLYCVQCGRLLVVPQYLDYLDTADGRKCIPCLDKPISL